MKIAVFINEYGNVLPFFSSGVVELYSDDSGEWQCVNQIPFDLDNMVGINDMNMRIRMLASEFEDCEMLVIENIKGLAKVILEEFKIGIWQFKGIFLFRLLDKIKDELLKAKETQTKNIVTPVLVGEAADAVYEINLGVILDNDCGLNSREILIPFIQNTNFRKLTIDCNHTPKWFEAIMCLLQLKYEITETEDSPIRIVVEPFDFEAGITERQRIHVEKEGGGCSSGCC
jgi:Fe-only nitrogenase accessory protein AnfO